MCRDIRVHDNDALLFAQKLAKEKGAKLVVNYIIWNYVWEGATRRFYDWVIPSLKEVEKELREYNIPFVITFEERRLFEDRTSAIPSHIGAVVIDQLPLHFMSRWKKVFIDNHATIPLYEVDAHNCIPVWVTSNKQEFAAHTIRRKIHALLPEYMERPFEKLLNHSENFDTLLSFPGIAWEEVSKNIVCDETISGTGAFVPGERKAQEMMTIFFNERLHSYEVDRNTIHIDGQSNLSPYLAHGNISRRRIVSELCKMKNISVAQAFSAVANGSNGSMGSIASFIEECVVRAEIAENYCFYNKQYDSYEGFPDWAKETLTKAKTDKRIYVYTFEEFRNAQTHDEIWNAAQMQMVKTGKMHGYMRMYWAKKILEWSKSPEEAMSIAVRLNDLYELDGRDPNGYVGCAWSIGGVHDRPWFKRPIFGAVRYMAESGVAKQGKIKVYIEKYLGAQQKLL
jgi:deoxyribodipyrimidine photo-lyase